MPLAVAIERFSGPPIPFNKLPTGDRPDHDHSGSGQPEWGRCGPVELVDPDRRPPLSARLRCVRTRRTVARYGRVRADAAPRGIRAADISAEQQLLGQRRTGHHELSTWSGPRDYRARRITQHRQHRVAVTNSGVYGRQQLRPATTSWLHSRSSFLSSRSHHGCPHMLLDVSLRHSSRLIRFGCSAAIVCCTAIV